MIFLGFLLEVFYRIFGADSSAGRWGRVGWFLQTTSDYLYGIERLLIYVLSAIEIG